MAGELAGVFSGIPAAATAQALALALTPIAGSRPEVVTHSDYSEVIFTPQQESQVSAWILTQLRKEPGPVRIDTGRIAMQVITRQYWPYMLALALAGAALGYMVTKKKARR